MEKDDGTILFANNSSDLKKIKTELKAILVEDNQVYIILNESVKTFEYISLKKRWISGYEKFTTNEMVNILVDKDREGVAIIRVKTDVIWQLKIPGNLCIYSGSNGLAQVNEGFVDVPINSSEEILENSKVVDIETVKGNVLEFLKGKEKVTVKVTPVFGKETLFSYENEKWELDNKNVDIESVFSSIFKFPKVLSVEIEKVDIPIQWSFLAKDKYLVYHNADSIKKYAYLSYLKSKLEKESNPDFNVIGLDGTKTEIKNALNYHVDKVKVITKKGETLNFKKSTEKWSDSNNSYTDDEFVNYLITFNSVNEIEVDYIGKKMAKDLKLEDLEILKIEFNEDVNMYTLSCQKHCESLLKRPEEVKLSQKTAIKINSCSIAIRDGVIYDVRVNDENGNEYYSDNTTYPLSYLVNKKKDLALVNKKDSMTKVLLFSDVFVAKVDPSQYALTDNLVLALENPDSVYIVKKSNRALNNYLDLRVYTDLLALLNQQQNGILQFEGRANFFLNERTWGRNNAFIFRYIQPYLRFSKISNGVSNEVNIKYENDEYTLQGHPIDFNQRAFLELGAYFNLYHYNRFNNSFAIDFDVVAEFNMTNANVINKTDTTKLESFYRSALYGFRLAFNVNNDKNFGMNFGGEILTQNLSGTPRIDNWQVPATQSNPVTFHNASLFSVFKFFGEIYFSPKNWEDALFLRFNVFDDTRTSYGDYTEIQLGWKTDLDLSKKSLNRE
jgi:hypothetical protein